jgi:hypothetical protein
MRFWCVLINCTCACVIFHFIPPMSQLYGYLFIAIVRSVLLCSALLLDLRNNSLLRVSAKNKNYRARQSSTFYFDDFLSFELWRELIDGFSIHSDGKYHALADLGSRTVAYVPGARTRHLLR